MAFGKEWICDPSNIRVYVDVIKNWIFARLFSYMTPFFPPYLKNGCRHIAEEIHFSTDEKKLFRTHTAAKDDYYRVMQRLTTAKKTSCTCDPHHVIRVLGLMNLLKVTEVDGPFGAVYSILAIMVRHAPIGYTFTVTVDACLQDSFDPTKDKCVKYLYWVWYDINSMFSLTLCDTLKQDNHTCDGVLACINNMDHIADHSVNGHTLKNVHGQVRILKIPGKNSGSQEVPRMKERVLHQLHNILKTQGLVQLLHHHKPGRRKRHPKLLMQILQEKPNSTQMKSGRNFLSCMPGSVQWTNYLIFQMVVIQMKISPNLDMEFVTNQTMTVLRTTNTLPRKL